MNFVDNHRNEFFIRYLSAARGRVLTVVLYDKHTVETAFYRIGNALLYGIRFYSEPFRSDVIRQRYYGFLPEHVFYHEKQVFITFFVRQYAPFK